MLLGSSKRDETVDRDRMGAGVLGASMTVCTRVGRLGCAAMTAAAFLAMGITGCGMNGGTATPVSVSGQGIGGKVWGGDQPVSGALIQLYAPATTGYGTAALPLLTRTVLTDQNGNFRITGDFTCPSPSTP